MSENNNTLPTYLQLISKDEKEVKLEGLQIKAQESSIEIQREIMSLNSEIAKTRSMITKAQRMIPYSVKAEYLLVEKLGGAIRKLEFAKAIKQQRFSDVSI